MDISIEKTLKTSKRAIFVGSLFFDWGQKYSKRPELLSCLVRLKKCKWLNQNTNKVLFKFKPVWKTHVPYNHLSVMMKKGSQFTRFFVHEMKKLESTGILDILRKRYSGIQACKQPLKVKPMGFEKLSFLFSMLIIGFITSILVVLIEYMTKTKKKKQEITNKDEEITLIKQKMGEYLEGLSYQETENILGTLFLHYTKMEKDGMK